MRAQPALPDESFAPAPAGARVRGMALLVVLVIIIIMAAQAWFIPRSRGADYWISLCAPLVAVPIVAAVAWSARVRALRLEGGDLVVVRAWFPVRFRLEGLESVERDREPLAGARKIRGNDGLGAVSGRFRSKKFGDFRVYLSDANQAVVVRSSAGVVVVSPAQPEIFIDAVRRRGGRS